MKNGVTAKITVSQGMKKYKNLCKILQTKNSTGQREGGKGLKIFVEVAWVTGFIEKLWSDSRVKIGALKINF